MPDSKAAILARIAAAGHRAAGPIPRDYQRTRDLGGLVDLAAERIADYQATVHRCTPAELPARIGDVLTARSPGTMTAPPGVPAAW
ncbi:MAG TPA: lactate utilization protein C, partial [Pseudonocardiaceae bacterium]|nr:lactate utilization protein C [Pseudonocardiaceae bacterium]